MKLCTYRSASKFLERTQERLEQEEAFNNLLLGTCLRLRRRTNRLKAPPYFATVEDSGRLVTSAVRTPPYKLLLHGAADAEALARRIASEGYTHILVDHKAPRDLWAQKFGYFGDSQEALDRFMAMIRAYCRPLHAHDRAVLFELAPPD